MADRHRVPVPIPGMGGQSMKSKTIARTVHLALAVLLTIVPGSAQGAQPTNVPKPNQAAIHPGNRSESEQGQQVFNQNCSRCHKAPETIPPSIAGTVALHMRIRAGLSERDYKRLLAFLNP
jgi:cytochrome c5